MLLNPQRITTREKLILTGLYLSKYDSLGLRKLGFDNFIEAFNVIGYALGSKPMNIKNYRDEFDPLFPNKRKGWHKRPTRDYCLKVYETYKGLDFETFTSLVESFTGYNENTWSEVQTKGEVAETDSFFAKRLITGLAAEQYFEAVQPDIFEFKGYVLENTTRLGCGYDFRLRKEAEDDYLAIEVKGLKAKTGSLSLTPKEYDVAASLTNRFFLFVVKNFRETPFHVIYPTPLAGQLRFKKKERVTVNISWLASV